MFPVVAFVEPQERVGAIYFCCETEADEGVGKIALGCLDTFVFVLLMQTILWQAAREGASTPREAPKGGPLGNPSYRG